MELARTIYNLESLAVRYCNGEGTTKFIIIEGNEMEENDCEEFENFVNATFPVPYSTPLTEQHSPKFTKLTITYKFE
jgi:hypothetical protein